LILNGAVNSQQFSSRFRNDASCFAFVFFSSHFKVKYKNLKIGMENCQKHIISGSLEKAALFTSEIDLESSTDKPAGLIVFPKILQKNLNR
jgi:hypothetical protein